MEFEASLIEQAIELAIREDLHDNGDLTSTIVVPPGTYREHVCRLQEDGVIAGLATAERVFRHIDPNVAVEPLVSDGSQVPAGTEVAIIRGPARSILSGERTALNFLQRMSGIATHTRRFVQAVHGTRACILDTRKTAPGLRVFDKTAVRLGGGHNHRFGLYDMIMIKDNHIAAAGSIAAAVGAAVQQRPFGVEIEVEVDTIEQLREVLDTQADRILLDNMSLIEMREAVNLTHKQVPLEASGNITLANVAEVAATGVDFISVGSLTHSVTALDIHLETLSQGEHYAKR